MPPAVRGATIAYLGRGEEEEKESACRGALPKEKRMKHLSNVPVIAISLSQHTL